jgi:hypothetical protein
VRIETIEHRADIRFLASLRDAVLFVLGSGGVGRVATSTTGLSLPSHRLEAPLKIMGKHFIMMGLFCACSLGCGYAALGCAVPRQSPARFTRSPASCFF